MSEHTHIGDVRCVVCRYVQRVVNACALCVNIAVARLLKMVANGMSDCGARVAVFRANKERFFGCRS